MKTSFYNLKLSLLYTIVFMFFIPSSVVSGQGSLTNITFYSNSLGSTRNVQIYLPAGYNPNDTMRYPVDYYLHGATGDHTSFPELAGILDSMISNNIISPVIVVKPDGSIGPWAGSCYTNSELYGNFEDYIVYDLVEFIDSAYKTIPARDKRTIWGGSMGGYGSMKLGLKHPDIYCAIASHSGPIDFSHWVDWVPTILNENGGPPVYDYVPTPYSFTWLFYTATGAFSPDLNNPPYQVDFPLDSLGNIIDSVFNRWQLHNPVRLAANLPPNSAPAIYFDCGRQDELLIYPFNTGFADSLDLIGINYIFESFNGTHTSETLNRTPVALRFLDCVLYGHICAVKPFIDKTYARKNIDSVLFRTEFLNIYDHLFTTRLLYENSGNTLLDSILLFDDGLHGDSLFNDGIYGNYILPQENENFYHLDISTSDNQNGGYYATPTTLRFTTAGPVTIDSVAFIEGSGHYYLLRPFVSNEGSALTIINAKIRLLCNDTWALPTNALMDLPDLPPGGSGGTSGWFSQHYVDSLFPGYFNLKVEILSDEYPFWQDSIHLIVEPIRIETGEQRSLTYALWQNYPNPFNPTTKISWQSPVSGWQTLKVFDILGREVATLVDEYRPAGRYNVEFIINNEQLSSGVYLYRLQASPTGGQAGSYTAVRKMIYLK